MISKETKVDDLNERKGTTTGYPCMTVEARVIRLGIAASQHPLLTLTAPLLLRKVANYTQLATEALASSSSGPSSAEVAK